MDERLQNPKVAHAMRNMTRVFEEEMPPGYGFTLLIFSYGEERERYYLSSARREDAIKLLKEFITRQEQQKAA